MGRDRSRILLSAANDLSLVTARHAPALRRAGLDDVVERLEEIVLVLGTGAQELGAAMEGIPVVQPTKRSGDPGEDDSGEG
jgi:hypothetical protein